MKQLTEEEVTELIDALLRQRLLQQIEVDRFKPVMQLTPRGDEVMKGKTPLADVVPLSESLMTRLRSMQVKQPTAKPAAKPTERAARPAEEPEFDPFADVDSELEESLPTSQPVKPAIPASRVEHPTANHVAAPHYWTWRVMSAGFSPAECREIRRLDEDTFCDHVLRSARDGRPIDAAWVLTRQQLETVAAAVGDGSPKRLQAVLARLPAGIKYRDVQVYLLSRGLGTS